MLCKLDKKISAEKLAETLLVKYKIFIKDLSSKRGFESGQFIRLAVRDQNDNDLLLCALKEILKG